MGERKGALAGTLSIAFFALAAVLSASSPPERTLGAVYRIVMFHGGMAVVAFAAIGIAGLAGVVALVRPGRLADALVGSGQETAALAFLVYFVTAYWAMVRAWYGPLLEEPRFGAAVVILFAGGVAYALSLLLHRPRVRAGLSAAVGGLATYLLASTPLFFHPQNPVRGGSSAGAKAFFYAIVASLAVSTAAFWWMRIEAWLRHADEAHAGSGSHSVAHRD